MKQKPDETLRIKELRELRLWHWRKAMEKRLQSKLALERSQVHTGRYSEQMKDICYQRDDEANFHISAVQTLNQFFEIGDTAERDDEASKQTPKASERDFIGMPTIAKKDDLHHLPPGRYLLRGEAAEEIAAAAARLEAKIARNRAYGPAGDAGRNQTRSSRQPLLYCAAASDGECSDAQCPQLRDGEPQRSGRHCPLDVHTDEN